MSLLGPHIVLVRLHGLFGTPWVVLETLGGCPFRDPMVCFWIPCVRFWDPMGCFLGPRELLLGPPWAVLGHHGLYIDQNDDERNMYWYVKRLCCACGCMYEFLAIVPTRAFRDWIRATRD